MTTANTGARVREFNVLTDATYALRCHRDESTLRAPHWVPWSLVEPHEAQAIKNHGRDLYDIEMHGGLYPAQIAALLLDVEACEISTEEAVKFLHLLLIAERKKAEMVKEVAEAAERLGFSLRERITTPLEVTGAGWYD